jgi:hypothetical protein
VIQRLVAIVRADLLIRFRRPSTLVVFLLLSAFAYVWIPDPSTGRAIMQMGDQRVVYNSAALGVATAMLANLFIGLAGFYVVSNAIRRDVQSRCGFVIASTTMRAGEYLLGKVLGNIVFLSTFVGGFMATSMVMQLVRGEAPLEPLVFAKQYLVLVPPAIVMVSVLAILFESIPFLSGKFGDVAYFFVWAIGLGAVGAASSGKAPGFVSLFDSSGFSVMRALMPTDHLAIGASPFDAAKGTFLFEGLNPSAGWIGTRVAATVWPLLLIGVAIVFFHRFDPARLKNAMKKTSRNWLTRAGNLAKPITRALWSAGVPSRAGSIFGAARIDALMAMTSTPLTIVLVAVFALMGRDALPIAFAAAAVLIADVASREARAGTLGLLYSAPRLKSQFVLWKFLAAFFVAVIVLAGPLARNVSTILPLLGGILFIAAFATALGVISSNPKTFVVLFLTFWYVVVNDHGRSRALDFAGFYGAVPPAVMAAYAGMAVAALIVAQLVYAARLRRVW